MAIYVVSEPAVEPLSTSEAKTHLRVDTTDDDTYIGSLITLARVAVERRISRSLITQTRALTLSHWPECPWYIRLPMGPVQSITHIKYYDDDDVLQTLSASAYQTDFVSEMPRVALAPGQSWPEIDIEKLNPITITYVAGYGVAGANVPQILRHAMLLLIGHLYETREAVSLDNMPRIVPLAFENLLSQYDISWAEY